MHVRNAPARRTTDVNECVVTPGLCEEAGRTCVNTNGSFECQCPPGYEEDPGDVGGRCRDVYECNVTSDLCAPEATCTNLVGSYECSCDEGYTGNGTTCEDIDECAEIVGVCVGVDEVGDRVGVGCVGWCWWW